ncbi:MAG: apolipoprotein N-acyltransferase [Nitrospira sp.]|nr:MAG: apolipoprotein N-acyltransferase [Nitrospira sp.]
MSWPTVRPWIFAGLSGVLLPLCFPHFDLAWLAWVALVPLHLALADLSPRRALYLGWAAGLVSSVGIVWWVITAMHLFGKMPLAPSFAVMLLLAGYLGLYVGLYAAGVVLIQSWYRRWLILAAPCLWVALELLRTSFLSGFPWELLGYSQYRWLTVIQVADVTAVYGISFVIVMVNVAVAEITRWALGVSPTPDRTPAPRLPWAPALAAGLVVAIVLCYGAVRIGQVADAMTGPSLTIGLVQANIDQAHKWDAAYRRETLDRYERLTKQAAPGSDLIIWPEAATPFLFEQETPYRAEVNALVQSQGIPLLFGSPAIGFYGNGKPYLLNSAYLLSDDARIAGRYDKQHLVPFGEYIPLKSSVLFFLDKLVEGIGDFEAGTEPTILTIPQKAPPAGGTATEQSQPGATVTPTATARFGVAICYEVIFPDLVRRFVDRGADFMVTITNDAWFGESSAPYQHFGMMVFRAVENRTAFARAANTGISGFVDRDGRILEASPIFEERTLSRRLTVAKRPTFYSKYGDVFAYGCAIIAAFFTVAAWRRERN